MSEISRLAIEMAGRFEIRLNMEVAWKIDVLTKNGERSSRILNCLTEDLKDPVARYQIEMLAYFGFQRNGKLKRFRSFFKERGDVSPRGMQFSILFLDGYWEDGVGNEVSKSQAWQQLFGIPQNSLQLVSTAPHYVNLQIELANGKPPFGTPMPSYTPEQQFILRHFTRDARELAQSRFYAEDGSFSLSGPVNGPMRLTTIAIEHIGHFTSVFRRIYGEQEPAGIKGLCNLIESSIDATPFGQWLKVERQMLDEYLDQHVTLTPFSNIQPMSFKNRELIRNFIYGKFLHQPNAQQEITRGQWAQEIGGNDKLEFSFHYATKHVASHLINWGSMTARLCKAVGINLELDSAGTNVDEIQRPIARAETRLSTQQREHFDSCTAELAFALRASNSNCVSHSAAEILEIARCYLREIL